MTIRSSLSVRATIVSIAVAVISGRHGHIDAVQSMNQPMLCPSAAWDPNAITFANQTQIGNYPTAVFVSVHDTVYVVDPQNNSILVIPNGTIDSAQTLRGNFSTAISIFVTHKNDILVSTFLEQSLTVHWSSNATVSVSLPNFEQKCYGLFVDTDDNLYCSMPDKNQVSKRSLNDSTNASVVVAGTGYSGSSANELRVPVGIFVDQNFSLYVADCENHRVQLFYPPDEDAITVAGETSPEITISLRCPAALLLDGGGYLFIVDYTHHRIVGSSAGGFRCIVGCLGRGEAPHQLLEPIAASFDMNGNLLVADKKNHRIQKFLLQPRSCDTPLPHKSAYRSNLTSDSPTYSRTCTRSQYHYQTIRITVTVAGNYTILSESQMDAYGAIYHHKFNRFNPTQNLLAQEDGGHSDNQFKMIVYLQVHQVYILVLTTHEPDKTGPFIVVVSGPTNAMLEQFDQGSDEHCYIGGPCSPHIKGVGIILDDILRYEINSKTPLSQQSLPIKMSIAIVTLMFVAGLINSLFSWLSFQNPTARQVGCGLYLLASSVTSLLTICMLMVKFWFVVLAHMNAAISLSILRGGCRMIEPLLKLCLYWDGWINACVAIERAIHVYRGVNFDKANSKRIARWMIIALPCCIAATIIHEPLFSTVIEYNDDTHEHGTERPTGNIMQSGTNSVIQGHVIERYDWCVTRYSSSVQTYNTAILFVHLLGPFVANLASALFIISGSARRRSNVQTRRTYRYHMREQLHEHRQLVISPAILLVLSLPRLIIALLPGCVEVSGNPWLYLTGYFISFIPSVLIFVVYALPSEMYRSTFRESLRSWQRRIRL